jgi:hypothetical protein
VALIHANSLSETVDAVLDAQFERRPIPAAEAREAGRWIAARQGLPGSYGGTFAAFDSERRSGILLFTGERADNASARHILGEETCRALRLLAVPDPAVQPALDRANAGLMGCLERVAGDPRHRNPGFFCCGKCSAGFWRNLLSGGLDRQEERLQQGARLLRSHRDGEGGWRRFPFWYTVLALQEMHSREASSEVEYARPRLERAAARNSAELYGQRRHALACRLLGRSAAAR